MLVHASVLFTRVALLGWVCLAAGLLGLASAIILIVIQPSVGIDHFSYPLAPGGFAVAQVWFFVHHFGLLAGVYALWRSGVVGTGRLARVGSWGAIVSIALLAACELVAISAADALRPSGRTDTMDSLYGISSILVGITLIVAGVSVIRTGRWQGLRRFLPLALGVYIFVPLTPALFASFLLARLAIGGWMLGFAFLGWALIRTAADAGRPAPSGALPVAGANLSGQTEGSR
jgi:hypothetical protein